MTTRRLTLDDIVEEYKTLNQLRKRWHEYGYNVAQAHNNLLDSLTAIQGNGIPRNMVKYTVQGINDYLKSNQTLDT